MLKKVVSCFLAVVFVMQCATFSSYSVPTSSVPTLAVPTSSVPFADGFVDGVNSDEEAVLELAGGDGEVQYCIEVPEVIDFYLDLQNYESTIKDGRVYLRRFFRMNCCSIPDGYYVSVYLTFLSEDQLNIAFNLDGETAEDEKAYFTKTGSCTMGCSLIMSDTCCGTFVEGEERLVGKIVYKVFCKPLKTSNNASDVPNNQSDI